MPPTRPTRLPEAGSTGPASPVPPAGSVPGDEARRGPPPELHAHAPVEAWFDGACEPVNPGGVGTWGFVVREGGLTVAEASGPVAEAAGEAMTNNVAEYEALERLLAWLGAERPHRPVRVHGDSSLVLNQVTGAWAAKAPHLRARRDRCRKLLEALGPVEFVHVLREANADADRLTHEAYVRALEDDAAAGGPLSARLRPHLATAEQVEACRRLGIPVYAFLGRREAARLLERAGAAAPAPSAAVPPELPGGEGGAGDSPPRAGGPTGHRGGGSG